MYTSIESLGCTLGTNRMLYVNYTSVEINTQDMTQAFVVKCNIKG